MLYATRFFTSLAIVLWALSMVLLGLVNGVLLWIVVGLVLIAVGAPLLASHPWAAARLYPPRGAIDPTAGR
jgi:hypothetical protein